MDDQASEPSWRNAWRSPLRFATIFFAVFVLFQFLWATRSILITGFLGLLFGVSMLPAVDRLHRWRIPRGAGAALVVLLFFTALVGIGAFLAPILQTQAAELRQRLPEAIDRIDREISAHRASIGWSLIQARPAELNPRTAVLPAPPSPLRALLARQLVAVVPYLFPFFSTTVAALTGIILIVFLAIFIATDPETYERGILHLVPHPHRPRAEAVMATMGQTLRAWMMARAIAMVTIGIVVSATMAALGVRAAVALGVIAGLLEFVPVFGPIIGAVPAIALGFLDSPQKAFWVLIAFLIIQQLEGNILIPMLLQRNVEVPAALSLIGIASLAIVLGLLGVLIAEPLVAAALVAVKMLYVEPVIGDVMTKQG